MSRRYHPGANIDLSEGAAHYEAQVPGLGEKFLARVEWEMAFIGRNPEAGRPIRGPVRKWSVRQFPYSVIYSEEADYVLILAIAHSGRSPSYWHRRIAR